MKSISGARLALLAAALALGSPAARADEAPEHSFTGKLALYSEYEYRGISQTSGKPALQLNLDYAHRGGFYLGTFLSNIEWLKDTARANGFSTNADLEWDIYGGYRFDVVKDWTLDVGYLRYEYPRSGAFDPRPDTDEVYAGITRGPATLKYSYSFHDTFGVPDSKGSDYLELSVNQPIIDKWAFNGVLGHQRYKGTQIHEFHNGDLSYTVWKLGATYDFGRGFTAGAYWKGTDAHHELYTVEGKDWSRDRVVGFVAYTF